MIASLFLLFNHHFTPEQEADSTASLGVEGIVVLPAHLQEIWSSIPPDTGEIDPFLAPIKEWLKAEARPGDFVLVQGDFGATYLMVRFAFENGLIPVYSTSERRAVENHHPDGSVTSPTIFGTADFVHTGGKNGQSVHLYSWDHQL